MDYCLSDETMVTEHNKGAYDRHFDKCRPDGLDLEVITGALYLPRPPNPGHGTPPAWLSKVSSFVYGKYSVGLNELSDGPIR